ncbi:phospholipid-transporting ATPase VA [Monodelphis domestica]|uniref:phospholipid-transporting ATPase VA n=1 Tax=Monodelphis domestica TaxID=13616 RepID=UPI0024E24542|nr:phospholipid-transporting ATPase VA [Monodelphis domestica]
MERDGGEKRKETVSGEEGAQGQEEPRRHRQQRRRRRRESKTRTVRSNLLPPPGGGEPEVVVKGTSHPWRRRQGSSQYLADNRLKTTKYTVLSFLPKNLFEQFHRLANVYFVLIALFNFVPVLNAFQPELALAPVLFILAVTAIKDLWEDYSRHRSDHEINHMDCLVYCRDEKKYVNRYWKEVRVGDFVQLRCNEIIPADILLLSSSDPDGLCHIETANLDGETNLKQRQVVREFLELDAEFNPMKFTSVIECEKPNNDLSRFRGYIIHENGKKAALYKENLLLRGCTIRNTEEITGIVIYAGHETKALLNNSGPRYKRSKLERQMNMDVLWCVLILIVMCLLSAIGHGLWVWQYGERKKPLFDVPESDGSYLSPVLAAVYLFLTMIIVLQVLIPISLYVSIEIVKICQVFFIHQDKELYDEETDSKLQCRALNITEDLGQIQYIFSDKTGTLTENKMVFRRCTVSGIEYSHDANARRIAMYQEADSEEEESAPKGGTLSQRGSIGSHQSVKVVHRTQSTKSHRRTGSRAEAKRASILSKHTAFSSPMEKDITPDPKLFEKVNECARCLEIMRNEEKSLSHLTPELADIFDFFIALTICNTVVVTAPNQPRHKVRVRFELKSPVKTIEDFIRRFTPSRLTSGSNSGSSSSLSTSKSTHKTGSSFLSTLSTESTLLKLEARLTRSSPKMNNNGYGVQPAGGWTTENGLKEGELRYEAESPDEAALVYAARAYNCSLVGRLPDQVSVELPHLGRLTFELLHTLGFDSIRKRMSVVIRHPLTDEINVYTKGADSVMMDLLLPCSSDDSKGKHQKKIQSKTQNYLNLYAVDGLRTLCIAKKVLSKEEYACWLQSHLEAESSLENRDELLFQSAIRLETNLHLLGSSELSLFRQCPTFGNGNPFPQSPFLFCFVFPQEYQPHMFWMNMIDAVYQSLVCFFIPYLTYHDSDVDLFSWGTVITTIALFTIILHLGIETKTWTWLHWTACGFSILLFFIVALVYNASCSTCFPPSNPYWIMQRLMGDPMFYLTSIISSVAALLPRFFYRTFQGTLFPTQLQLGRQLARWTPNDLDVHKDTISQQHPTREQELQSSASKSSDTSGPYPQDHSSLASQSGHQPVSVTESQTGHRTAIVNAQPMAHDAVMDSLRGHSPVPQRTEGSVQEGPSGDSEGESSTREASPLSSVLDLPDFSLLNWFSSTPLFNGFGRAFRLSQSSLQTDMLGSTFLSVGSQLDQDLKGLKRETSDCFQEKVKGTTAVCRNSENLETTFL